MTPKRMRIEPGHIGEKQKDNIQQTNQLSMDRDGQKTPDGRNAKLAQKELAQIMIDLLGLQLTN